MSKPQCHAGSNCSYSMHGAHLHKTSRQDAMVRDPRRDLLGEDRDILLRDKTRPETHWSDIETLRILSKTRPR